MIRRILPTPSQTGITRQFRPFITLLFLLATILLSGVKPMQAQTFQPIAGLSFTMPFGAVNPLPQVLTAVSAGSNFSFTATASTASSGSWLQLNQSTNQVGAYTPDTIRVGISAAGKAAGTYTGQIVLTPNSGGTNLTVPVTLIIEASTSTFFDNLPGQMSFSMLTNGTAPPAQALQIRNAGAGTLSWTGSTSTADGGAWLALSASSGVAPGTITVQVNLKKLPGNGQTPGTFLGQLKLTAAGDTVTIPVTLTVGDSVFQQINPLNFTMPYGAVNPLPQILTVASTGTNFWFNASPANAKGGNWLLLNQSTNQVGGDTPNAIQVSISAAGLAAGVYTSEVLVNSNDGTKAITVPVTLTINPANAAFFDNLSGQIAFSLATGSDAPPAQPLQIRSAGTGTLSWTGSISTSDSGNWLSLSAKSGTAPETISVAINPLNLPGGGQTAGTFVGQILLQTTSGVATVPVAVTVGDNVFEQASPLNFTMPFGAVNPLPQVLTVASTGTNFWFYALPVNAKGGNWLLLNKSTNQVGSDTPDAIQVSVSAAGLAAGTYTAEVLVTSNDRTQSMIVPVTLTVNPATAAFFDNLPGELTFSLVTGGNPPPPQPLQIRNAGAGTLDWTGSVSTSDGGNWLSLSAESGVAPDTILVHVNPLDLPGGGQTAGTFTGQVILQTASGTVTIPVSVTVGTNVFWQVNPLNFTMPYGGANPLPQVLTVASAGTNFYFNALPVNGKGGNWLQLNQSTNQLGTDTPDAIRVGVSAAGLAAGVYTAEVLVTSSGGTQSMTVPVTLTVSPATSTFFDSLPGGVSFFSTVSGSTPPAQKLSIRNGGAGTLEWTLSSTTSDTGKWLNVSAASGTAPSTITVSLNPLNLPGGGAIAGTFTGEIVLDTAGDRVTIPVSLVVGPNVFVSQSALSFTQPYNGTSPLPQTLSLASTGSDFWFSALPFNAGGGNWLQLNKSTNQVGTDTPDAISVGVSAATGLAAGVYTAEVIASSSGGTLAQIVPVTLTVTTTTPAVAPVFSPQGGTFTSAQLVTITASTPDSAIYYTTNGTNPTTSSAVYSEPISVTASKTIKAIAVATGYPNSAVASATYTITPPAPTPTFTPAGGTYTSAQTVKIADTATTGLAIYYTINGSTPTTASTLYTSAGISVTATETIKAIAVATGYSSSAVATATYTIPLTVTATPAFSVKAGTYSSVQTITISDTTTGAAIYYTTNGAAPTASSTKYTGAITVSATETIKAIAVAVGLANSAVASAAYTIVGSPSALAAPATGIATPNATLNAIVDTLGLAGSYYFQYGVSSTALTTSTAKTALSASAAPVAVSAQLTTLKTKTTYYYQVVVTTAGGSATGAVLSFTTN